ncbi:GntR family transcriptional regulator [Planotetraspora thailandica]|uniref:GntR family transcriptional regulator n=1 Tax=Planotetraspora thailandica TaxID=487172 RepID=UPI003570C778
MTRCTTSRCQRGSGRFQGHWGAIGSSSTFPRGTQRTSADSLLGEGDLAPGDTVPSVADLRRLYDTSGNAVRQALAELQQAGLIMSRPGKRRFVRSRE